MASTTTRPNGNDPMQKRRGKGQQSTTSPSNPVGTTAPPSTPLRDRTHLTAANINSVSTKAESTFLPEFNSTPPMPGSFNPPVSHRQSPRGGKENDSPPTVTHIDTPPGSRPDSCTLPGILDPGNLLITTPSPRPVRWMTIKPSVFIERLNETPPLPDGWTEQHDRAICVLDVRNYTLHAIVAKIRRTFPGLRGTLTAGMVDRRLRQLDQDIEIDYYRVGLQGVKDGTSAFPASRVDSGITLKDGAERSTVKAVPSQSRSNLIGNTEQSTAQSRRGNAAVTQKFEMGYRTSHTSHAI